MPNPTRSDVHVDAALTSLSLAFEQEANNFVGTRAAPIVGVDKQSDRYYVYAREDWNRVEAKKRAPGTESAGGGWDVDNTPSYFADEYAVHKDVDDSIRNNADAVINMNRDATRYVTYQLMLKRDKIFSDTFMKTTVWDTDPVPAIKWDAASSIPIKDVHDAQANVKEATGFLPNVGVLGFKAWNALRNNAEILDRIKYTQKGVVSLDLLASLFDLDELILASAIENTAVEGAAESSAFMHNNESLLLMYKPAVPSILTPAAAYTFAWTGQLGAGATGMRISNFRMPHLRSDRIEGELAFDMKVVAPELGTFINDVLT